MTPPTVTPPGVYPAGSTFAPDSAVDVGVPRYFVQQDFLDMVARLYPDWYVGPLQTNADAGYELLQAYGALFEKASLAVGTLQVQCLIEFASGGQGAIASVEFYRASLASGAFAMKAGAVVQCSQSGRQFQLVADVSFGVDDYYVGALVQSLGQDDDYNVPGPVVTAAGELLLGEIDTVLLPYMDPPYAEPDIQVRQVADATGGSAPAVDSLGGDRGIRRAANEIDQNYKKRIRALPATITPDNIVQHLDSLFYPSQLHYDHIETWEVRYQTCWDAPNEIPSDPIFARSGPPTAWAFDDTRDSLFIPRWMDEGDHRAAFAIVLPTFPALFDHGMAYDDTVLTPTTNRSPSSWDDPSVDQPIMSGCWDGEDNAGQNSRVNFLSAMWTILDAIKGGGVGIALFQTETNEVLPGAPYP
jgi:hypothetical protein